MEYKYNKSQLNIINSPFDTRIFLKGEAGTGKTTASVERLIHLLNNGIAGESILLITPQRTLASPYLNALESYDLYNGGQVTNLTIGGLARRMIGIFWPMIAEEAGFAHPNHPPTFLTLETVQYFIAQIIRPLLDKGYFSSITIEHNRLYSQLIDNLNKAAVVGFPYQEFAERLKSAWGGDPGQLRVYEDAQVCANLFRDFCLKENLLDFSLQMEIFQKHLWPNKLCRQFLFSTYRHLLIDNIEEDTPVTHDLISEWLPECASALLIFDEDAGYRRFLGASPETGIQIQQFCDQTVVFENSFVMNPEVADLKHVLSQQIRKTAVKTTKNSKKSIAALKFDINRFYPGMLDWVSDQIAILINEENIPPGQIAVLSPFLSDALRFSLITRLTEKGIPVKSHRPSRALRDEPATLCLLTLALLAHPEWLENKPDLAPNRFDLAHTLVQTIDGLDLIRAQLLTSTLMKISKTANTPTIGSFDQLLPEMQERISYMIGEKYEYVRAWIIDYQNQKPVELDFFIARLFGEVLSQPGFGFHNNFNAAEITSNLIESIQKFRWVVENKFSTAENHLGIKYIELVRDGIIAAQYIRSWDTWNQDAVLIAPAYTFLMYNKPVDYQFWLDIGNKNWAERLFQPLTQPYVLSRTWERDKVWTDYDEVMTGQNSLYKLVSGLLSRCRHGIYLGLSNFGEQGYEQRGPLLSAVYKLLIQIND